MSRLALAILLSCSMSAFAQDFDLLSLEEFASGLSQPVGIKHAGDTSGRVFILEQSGLIKVVKNGVVNATPFLDLTGVIDNASNEQGLLGLAFHPDYVNNGYFYVNYTRDPGPGDDLTTIGRYQVSAGNPDVADTTETKILEIPQDAGNHNGGDIHFGPDGFLYIGMGDGGGSNDQFGHAQDILSLKGKMLRIDVNGSPVAGDVLCGQVQNYGIPPSNPFADVAGCDEIWSYGLRNPWRFSFDRQTGRSISVMWAKIPGRRSTWNQPPPAVETTAGPAVKANMILQVAMTAPVSARPTPSLNTVTAHIVPSLAAMFIVVPAACSMVTIFTGITALMLSGWRVRANPAGRQPSGHWRHRR